MKALNTFLLLGGLLLGLYGCQPSALPSDYVRYVSNPDNGLKRSKRVGQLQVDLQYKPIPYLIANELRRNDIQRSQFQERQQELSGSQYYNLQLSVPGDPQRNIISYGLRSEAELQERLYYLSFGMQHDIRLIDGADTLRPMLYHFERSYDLAPHRTFVLAFEQAPENKDQDKTLILDSPVLATGPLKLKIESKAIQNLPPLKLIQ